jgi:hypothetical protein
MMVQINGYHFKDLVSKLEVTVVLCQEILQHEIKSEEEFNEILLIRDKLVKQYENLYNTDAPNALGVDSRKTIQCLVNKINQLVEKRDFYYLIQSIDNVIPKIKYHFYNFPSIILEDNVFSSINNALKIYRESLDVLKLSISSLHQICKLDDRTTKRQLEEWAILLEKFSEELEANILFFSFQALSELENICNIIFLNTIKKNNIDCKRESFRRRLRSSSSSILRIIDQQFNEINEDFIPDNDCTVIKLNAEESQQFVNDFLSPSEPNQALKDAALFYKRMMSA